MKIQHCLLARCDRSAAIANSTPTPSPWVSAANGCTPRCQRWKLLKPARPPVRPKWPLKKTGLQPSREHWLRNTTSLNILESDIQDNAANATRFLVLGKQCSPATGQDRTSLMLSIDHSVGALHRAIAPFQSLKLNMTKIESRSQQAQGLGVFLLHRCRWSRGRHPSC